MGNRDNAIDYAKKLEDLCMRNDAVSKELYQQYGVKRGLRDENGKGVLTGLTNISEITAFKNVDGKQDGADEDQEIAKLDGQALRNAEKIEADDGQRHAEPDEQAAPFFEEQPEERDDDDIEGRNEPRLAHGRVHDADLLKTACEAEHHTAAHAADPELALRFRVRRPDAAGGDGVQPVEQRDAGNEEQAADKGAHAGKRVGAHIIHTYALGDEGHSPDDGGEKQQKGIPELQRVHGRCDSPRRPGMQ